MKKNLNATDRAAIVPSQEEQSAMIKELYDIVMYVCITSQDIGRLSCVVNAMRLQTNSIDILLTI
jgi:hypothetical protein